MLTAATTPSEAPIKAVATGVENSRHKLTEEVNVLRRHKRVAREESGFTLIEVMVSITILVIIAMSAAVVLLSVLRTTSNDRARVAAANLALREVEYVRDQFESAVQGPLAVDLGQTVDGAPLPGGTAGAPLVVDNRAYTVTRTAEWESQGDALGPCDGGASKALAYLRVSVRVTWADMGSTTPVTTATLLTPPLGTYNAGTGHIKAKVVDQNNVAEAGTTVTVTTSTGALVDSQLTASDGCAFFAFLAPGAYNVTLSRAGYVDPNGATSPAQTVTVTANTPAPASFQYAPSATVTFAFSTANPGYAPAPSTALTVLNQLITTTTHTFSYPASVPSRTLTTYPFPDGLAGWAGDCADADPAATSNTSTRPNPVATTAGQSTTGTVGGASLAVVVQRSGNSTTTVAGLTVEAVHATSGCPTSVKDPYDQTTVGEVLTFPVVTDSSGTARVLLPYGNWTIKVLNRTLPTSTAWPTVTLSSTASYPSQVNVTVA